MRRLLPVFVLSSAVALAPGCKSSYSACEDCGEEDGAPGGQGGDIQSSGGSTDEGCDDTQVACGDACIDPETDPSHCGARGSCEERDAGAACADDERCEEGECVLDCPEGTLNCFDSCIDPLSDALYCGASGACQAEDDTWGEFCVDDDVCVSGTCRGWGEGERVHSYPSLFVLDNVVNAQGHFAVLVADQVGGRTFLFSPEDTVGVENTGLPSSGSGGIWIDALGQGLVVLRDGSNQVSALTRMSGSDSWSTPAPLIPSPNLMVSQVRLVQLSDGGTTVVWSALDEGSGIYSQWSTYRDRDNNWDVPQQLANNSSSHLAALAASEGGRIVAWQTEDESEIRARLGGSEVWSGSQRLSHQDIDSAGVPQVGIDQDGNALVAWTEFNGMERSLWIRAFRVEEQQWQAGSEVAASVSVDSPDTRLVVTEQGGALLMWRKADGGGLECAVFSPDTLAVEVCEAPTFGATPLRPAVAAGVGDLSHAMLAWGAGSGIWTSLFDFRERKFRSPRLLEHTPVAPAFLSLKQDRHGRATLLWNSIEGGTGNLWVARFK